MHADFVARAAPVSMGNVPILGESRASRATDRQGMKGKGVPEGSSMLYRLVCFTWCGNSGNSSHAI